MSDLQRINFLGSLDGDTDPQYLKEGNYTDALNVRPLTDNTESSQSIVNIKGTQFAAAIPPTEYQFKQYALAVNSTATSASTLRWVIKNQNGSLIANISFAITSGSLTTAFNTQIYPALNSALGAATPPRSFTATLNTEDDIFGFVIFNFSTQGENYTITDATGSTEFIFVIQDAVDLSTAGNANVIGSYDLLGDLFVWSTSKTELPSILDLSIVTISNGTPSLVTTSAAHGLTIGQLIVINGASDSSYNGEWTVSSTPTSTTFTLANTQTLGASTGGTITINSKGMGEIGVITYNENTQVYTYTRLIRSSQLNFVTKKQIDAYVERNSSMVSLYWTDDYNVPRVMYYRGDYLEDGFLYNPFLETTGDYDLDTIDLETRLSLTQGPTSFTFLGQNQSGGSVLSGNWRYTYRFIGESGSATEWSDLSNPVSVFTSSTNGMATELSGDEAGVITPKSNSFSVSGIIPNIFKYIELAGVNYTSSNSQVGYIIRRELLGASTSIILNHTGFESVTSLDLGTLNVRSIFYNTAKNITAIDNRLVLSNLTVKETEDFGAWTSTWTHSLFKQPISTMGSYQSFKLGEYNDPNNVYNFLGYMDNEVYRFGVKFRLKDGRQTPTFWIDDILFNTGNTNINPDNRRVPGGGLPNYDLTDDAVSEVYASYVQFSNINLDTIINGVSARELIDEIIFERVECVKEILATGMAAMSVFDGSTSPVSQSLRFPDKTIFYNNFTGASTVQYAGEYPFIESFIINTGSSTTYDFISTQSRTVFSFYSPDIFYGNTSINNFSSANGDVILNYGNPDRGVTLKHNNVGHTYDSTYVEFDGYTNQTTFQTLNVNLLNNLSAGEEAPDIFGVSVGYSKKLLNYTTNTPAGTGQTIDLNWEYQGTPVIRTTSNLTNVAFATAGNADYGFYYVQYKRPIAYNSVDDNKYNNRTLSKYIPTGTTYIIDNSSPATITPAVFGGDTFTQKSFIKRRFATVDTYGLGAGGGFYSQNRVNSQLNKKYDNAESTWSYPNEDVVTWLELDSSEINSLVNYNTGYNPVNNINSDVAFDSSLDQVTDYPVRLIYSDLKLQNGLVDGYRNFLPLNFKDLDLAYGEIVHTANGNGELITWQPRKFQRQYFNTRGILETSTNLNVLIGDGSVLSRDGQTLSTIGSKHKWAIIRGKSPQGNDTFYWINTELKKAIRFGYDGTISLADVRGMMSFLANNLAFVDNKDNPADGEGICGVWDDRYMEVVWSVRGKRIFDAWSSSSNYTAGQTVSYTPSIFSTFEQTGEIYVALLASGPSSGGAKNPQTQPDYWQIVPHTNNNYYNEYTLVYNEMRNGFSSFYSFLPKIFLKWKSTYFSPKPIADTGRVFIHNSGDYCKWYDDEQVADGYIQGVVNKTPDMVKWYQALRANTEIKPYRYDFITKQQISFLTEGEITDREGVYDAPIKRDSTGTGVNDGDTTALFGKFLKVKMTFRNGVYQKLFDIIVKFRNSVRYFNK